MNEIIIQFIQKQTCATLCCIPAPVAPALHKWPTILPCSYDRKGVAEMSCIAGVGGNVKNLVKTAHSGRKMIVIDGCPLACSGACLNNHSLLNPMYILN